MKRNVGSIDRVVRITLGAGIIGVGIATQSWWGLLGIIPIAVALVGFCPLYPVCGVNTCQNKAEKSET